MPSDSIEPFVDNWAYLRAELGWLDRVLSLAIARQRQETKVVDRIARTRGDRVTSHWWKGLVTLEGETSYDSPAENPRRRSTLSKASYQQQLEAKIQVSHQRGILLGLPLLCHRLQLSILEKNLLLMALAPEISRRYARLYNYLQETEQAEATGLPTVDLALRLLCRTDAEWRSLRSSLTDDSALIKHHLLELRSPQTASLLAHLVKLPDPLVNYLLADQPESNVLESLLDPLPSSLSPPPSPLSLLPPPSQDLWAQLIFSPPLLTDLHHLCHRVQFGQQVNEDWGFAATEALTALGTIALLVGAPGTGKTFAARAIAQTLQTPLACVDLAQVPLEDALQLLQTIAVQAPMVLLLKSAHVWLSRTALLPPTVVQQFLALRQQHNGITLLSVHHKQRLTAHWRRQITPLLDFPLPDYTARLKLWQQAFPMQVSLNAEIDWHWLAKQFSLSGGEINAIARDAAIYAAAEASHVTIHHLIRACEMVKGKRGK
ncbi:MAG: AAA family ATPase [Stenomitos rutilans HA7619-LM2]|jgi:hypothetical protein|nr:AAA family ATPase [Stenomitos rutilans HA7619-LM2]